MKKLTVILLAACLLCSSCGLLWNEKGSGSSASVSSSQPSDSASASSSTPSSSSSSQPESSTSEESEAESEPESEAESGAEMTEVSYELDNGQVIRFSIPDTWKPDYSIIMNTKLDNEALAADFPDGIKVGEIGPNLIAAEKPELSEDYFTDDSGMEGKLLKMTRVEEGEQVYYLRQMESYPGGGAVKVWYPYKYFIWTGEGFAYLALYALEMNNLQTQELFTEIVNSVTFE